MLYNNPQPPKPVWVTTSEGGEYIPWHEWTRDWTDPADRKDKIGYKQGWQIHSVGFDNGWVFDNYGGWRTWKSKTEELLDTMAEIRKPTTKYMLVTDFGIVDLPEKPPDFSTKVFKETRYDEFTGKPYKIKREYPVYTGKLGKAWLAYEKYINNLCESVWRADGDDLTRLKITPFSQWLRHDPPAS